MKTKNIFRITKVIIYLFMIAGVSIMNSCSEFVDSPLPINAITANSAFSTDAGLVSSVNGAYAALVNIENNSTTLHGAQFADEIISLNTFGSDLQAQENTYDPSVDYGFFTNYYQCIYASNAIIEALDKPGALNDATATQVKGESYFLRAFCHFMLVNYYGSVPLITSTDVKITALQGNTPISTTYNAIISDLNKASGLLSENYPSESRVRANKFAAEALLARVYLYNKDYAGAEAAATKVISAGTYKLPDDLNNVFKDGSDETIWSLWNQRGYTPVAQTFIPDNTDNLFYQIRTELVNAFETGDARKDTWVKEGTGVSVGLYYPFKYQNRQAGSSIEYLVELRLGEQYLIRAEARAQLKKVTEGIADLYMIRKRAGLTNTIVVTDQDELLLKIEKERRIELMFEDGHRWFDLNRTGRTKFWLSPIKPTFTEKSVLLPYPTTILNTNPNLKQNSGY